MKKEIIPAKKKKKNKFKTVFLWTLMSFMLIAGIVCFAISYTLNQIQRSNTDLSGKDLGVNKDLPQGDDVVNIALFGLDSRSDVNSGRSDSIMVLTLDSIHGKVKVTSIMRDSQVHIDGLGDAKINSAYAYGGVELAIKTLNQNFGLNITDYISVNFNQMAKIFDEFGGVDVTITEAERKNANKYIKEMAKEEGIEPDLIKESGYQHLSGYQAVSYARIRYVGNADFQRTERQREVLGLLFEKVADANPVTYPSLLSKLLPMVETSMTNDEIMSIGTKMLLKGKPQFEQARLPEDGNYESEHYNLVYDLNEAKVKMHDFIYNDINFYNKDDSNTVIDKTTR